MAPLLGLALQALPSLLDIFDAPESVKRVSSGVAEVAQAITGTKNQDDAVKVLQQDPAKFAEFKLALEDKKLEWDRMYLADIQSARDRDTKLHQAGYRNYRATSMYILAVIMIGLLVWQVLALDGLNEYAKGIITLVLGRFLGYLDSIYNFEFGTTRGSKQKDETIGKLSNR